MNDSSVQMTWEPQGGDIAASGELGYTYGIYELRDGGDNVQRGTYVTIWKKQEDGKWKFVLDSGNQGLGD
jgi:ketosteroid isomerase-like protein